MNLDDKYIIMWRTPNKGVFTLVRPNPHRPEHRPEVMSLDEALEYADEFLENPDEFGFDVKYAVPALMAQEAFSLVLYSSHVPTSASLSSS